MWDDGSVFLVLRCSYTVCVPGFYFFGYRVFSFRSSGLSGFRCDQGRLTTVHAYWFVCIGMRGSALPISRKCAARCAGRRTRGPACCMRAAYLLAVDTLGYEHWRGGNSSMVGPVHMARIWARAERRESILRARGDDGGRGGLGEGGRRRAHRSVALAVVAESRLVIIVVESAGVGGCMAGPELRSRYARESRQRGVCVLPMVPRIAWSRCMHWSYA